jgi:hypothetical protein
MSSLDSEVKNKSRKKRHTAAYILTNKENEQCTSEGLLIDLLFDSPSGVFLPPGMTWCVNTVTKGVPHPVVVVTGMIQDSLSTSGQQLRAVSTRGEII